jgi:hypothetical protein
MFITYFLVSPGKFDEEVNISDFLVLFAGIIYLTPTPLPGERG